MIRSNDEWHGTGVDKVGDVAFLTGGRQVGAMTTIRVQVAHLLRRYLAAALCALAAFGTTATAQDGSRIQPYRDTSLTPEARAANLVSRMTLEEKVPQLLNDAPAIPRLGVRDRKSVV